MQKKLKSLLAIASLVAVAAIFFISCGNGEPVVLTDEKLLEIETSERSMIEELRDCIKNGCVGPGPVYSSSTPPVTTPSSSSPITTLSSSTPPVTTPSSSSRQVTTPSSSTPPVTTPSSSTVGRSSSTGGGGGGGGGKCVEDKPKAFTCGWDGYSATAVLTPGKILKPATYTLPSGCTSVAWNYAPNITEISLIYDCEALPSSGVSALGSKIYVLFAELTCGSEKSITACNPKAGWSSKKAPEWVGECVWSKNPTTSARGAKPSGVTITDTENTCGTSKIEYKYDGGTKTWPADGVVPAKKYTDVEATLSCSSGYINPVTMPCPALTVNAGSDHQITCSGDNVNAASCGDKGTINMANDECIDIEITWKANGYNPPLKFMCDGNFTSSSGAPTSSITLKYGTKETTGTGGYSISNHSITLTEKLETNKTVEFLGVCVSYKTTGTPPATIPCKLAAY